MLGGLRPFVKAMTRLFAMTSDYKVLRSVFANVFLSVKKWASFGKKTVSDPVQVICFLLQINNQTTVWPSRCLLVCVHQKFIILGINLFCQTTDLQLVSWILKDNQNMTVETTRSMVVGLQEQILSDVHANQVRMVDVTDKAFFDLFQLVLEVLQNQ